MANEGYDRARRIDRGSPLLWALQSKRTDAELQAAAGRFGTSIDLTRRPLERWNLDELIEYAHAPSLISDSTKAAADQDFATSAGRAIRSGGCNEIPWAEHGAESD